MLLCLRRPILSIIVRVASFDVVVTHSSYLSAIKNDLSLVTSSTVLSLVEGGVIHIRKIVDHIELNCIFLFNVMLLAEVIWFVHRDLKLILANVSSSIIRIHRLINELLIFISIKSTDELALMVRLIAHKLPYQTTPFLSYLRWSIQLALICKFLTVNLLYNAHGLILWKIWIVLSTSIISYLVTLSVRVRHNYRGWWSRDVCIVNFFNLLSIRMRLLWAGFDLKQCLSLQLNWFLRLI